MTNYNYTKFDANHYELVAFRGPDMGTKAPPVMVSDLGGNQKPLLDFNGKFLVLEFGSITCPLFQSRRSSMDRINRENPDVASKILYVREAHPGAEISAHVTQDDKIACARRLHDKDGQGREIVVDDMQGTAHQAYGSYPNAVFIINANGCVVYRSAWNNGAATARVLRRLLAGKSVRAESFFVPPRPPVAIGTFRQAGRGSARDFFVGLPQLAWKNLVRRNLRLIFGNRGRVSPDVGC